MNEQKIAEVLSLFGLDPETCSTRAFGTGHIHDTFIVERSSEEPVLLLQRMNHFVFKNIPVLMRNMELVTEEIAQHNKSAGLDPRENGIVLQLTPEGRSWVGDEEMGYWRLLYLIDAQVTFETAEDANLAFEGGKAIAVFQSQLSSLDPELVQDTIPGFLDLRGRLKQFYEALELGSDERIKRAEEMINVARKYAGSTLKVYSDSETCDVPIRITHNDTKFNNILYSRDQRATCLIDLDTVMKGYSWYDFGDALRTCASTAAEDEADVRKIGFDIRIFKGFAEGYMSVAKDFLTTDETRILHRAPAVFTFMQGIRFLADYLNNDVYYKTSYPEHNLVRARAQFTLMQSQLDQQPEMEEIIEKAVSS